MGLRVNMPIDTEPKTQKAASLPLDCGPFIFTLGRMTTAEGFSHLWNGSEPGWVVVRHTEDREKLRVLFSKNGPTISEVKSLRTVIAVLGEKPAAEVLATLKGLPEFGLGELESSAARKLRTQCEARGLRVATQAYQVVSHSLINELSKVFLLIEDSATNEAVAEEAIKQGLPVRHSFV